MSNQYWSILTISVHFQFLYSWCQTNIDRFGRFRYTSNFYIPGIEPILIDFDDFDVFLYFQCWADVAEGLLLGLEDIERKSWMDKGHRSNRGTLFVSLDRRGKGTDRTRFASDRRYPLVAHHPTRTIDRWTNVGRQAASLDVFLSVFRPPVEFLDLNSLDVVPVTGPRSPSRRLIIEKNWVIDKLRKSSGETRGYTAKCDAVPPALVSRIMSSLYGRYRARRSLTLRCRRHRRRPIVQERYTPMK